MKTGTLKYSEGGGDHAISGNTFTMPASDVTISAFFNKDIGFTIELPQDEAIGVTAVHSTGSTPATEISWTGGESVTFTLNSPGYSAEGLNLKWMLNGIAVTASGNSLTIQAQDYVRRSYTLTVMIEKDDQWYSTDISFKVTE
jgi:hypothetical protein